MSLTAKNYGILAAFIVNTLITYSSTIETPPAGSGNCIIGKTNTYLSLKYQSLFTPNGWAFSIWGLIFIGEGIFAIYQMFPSVRGSKTVDYMAYPWIASCVFQICWCFVFAQEHIVASTFMMIGILISLMVMQHYLLYVNKEELGYMKWWLLQAGPLLHLGWIIAASLLNINVSVVHDYPVTYSNVTSNTSVPLIESAANLKNRTVQLETFIISVALALLLGLYQTTGTLGLTKGADGKFAPHKTGTITAFAVMWASFGIYDQLNHPKTKTPRQFDEVTIGASKTAALFVAVVVLVMVAINIILLLVQLILPSMFAQVQKDEEMTKDIESQNSHHAAAPYLS